MEYKEFNILFRDNKGGSFLLTYDKIIGHSIVGGYLILEKEVSDSDEKDFIVNNLNDIIKYRIKTTYNGSN